MFDVQNFLDSYNKMLEKCKQLLLENNYLFSENEQFEGIEYITLSESGDSISVVFRIKVHGSSEKGIQSGSVGLNYFIPLYAFESDENKNKWIENTKKIIDTMNDLKNNPDMPEWLKSI